MLRMASRASGTLIWLLLELLFAILNDPFQFRFSTSRRSPFSLQLF
jgi:hypothetical protein